MQEFLNHPAVQAGLAPFLAALVVAGVFRRVRLSGLAVIAGFAVTVWLASSFNFTPLTATRKIILLGLGGAGLGLLLTLVRLSLFRAVLPILAAATSTWVALRVLQQQPPATALLWGAGCAAYVAVLVWFMDAIEGDALRAASAGTALGLGTGAAALIGASALLGQLGLALGAAAGAHLLIQFASNKTLSAGPAFTLPLALVAGLIGCMAVLIAKLPWYALPVLGLIPVVARLLPLPGNSLRIQSISLAFPLFILAGGAAFLAWHSAGDIPF